VCAQLGGFTSRSVAAEDASSPASQSTSVETNSAVTTLAPIWDPVAIDESTTLAHATERLLLIGAPEAAHQTLSQHFGEVLKLDPQPHESIEEIARKIEQLGSIDRVIWAFATPPQADLTDDSLIHAQQSGVMLCFKVIKAFFALGYQNRKLAWTVITEQTVATSLEDLIIAAHASVHGLMGSLAKENLSWTVQAIDLSLAPEYERLIPECLKLPKPAAWEEDTWAHRNGQWYRQKLLPYEVAGV
jgi:hypothetical protein